MPWDTNTYLPLDPFLTEAYHDSYVTIQGFLRDEQRVRQALLEFQQDVIDNGGELMDADFFETDYLTGVEAGFGFQPYRLVMNELQPKRFLAIVNNRQPIDDSGLQYPSREHGRSTHRIQWILIGREAEAGRMILAANVDQIYGSIGNGNLEDYNNVNNKSDLWDAVVDSQNIMNATCPEYLKGEWLEDPQQNDLELLRGLWR